MYRQKRIVFKFVSLITILAWPGLGKQKTMPAMLVLGLLLGMLLNTGSPASIHDER